MANEIITTCEEKMNKSIDVLSNILSQVRTGKANPAILNKVQVSYYGMMTPINQMASISCDAQTIVVKPYDKSIIKDVEKAILTADLGLNPQSDGEVIRVFIPPLTEEVRKTLVKQIKTEGENSKVNVRNIRRDGMDQLKKAEKNSEITEDDLDRFSDELQKTTDKACETIEKLVSDKEKQIMSF